MAVSDRIAVMKDGEIQHVGTPHAIYQRPANLFVSTFIGRSNVLECELRMEGERAMLVLPGGFAVEMNNAREEHRRDQRVMASIRPEEMLINKDGGEGIRVTIDDSVFLGLNTHYFVHTGEGVRAEIIRESDIGGILPAGTEICLTVNTKKLNLFTADGGENILTGVCNDNGLKQ